jgi:hypothetical protein
MKVEIPGSVIAFMVVVNIILLVIALVGFINLKYIIRDLKNRILKIMFEQRQFAANRKQGDVNSRKELN